MNPSIAIVAKKVAMEEKDEKTLTMHFVINRTQQRSMTFNLIAHCISLCQVILCFLCPLGLTFASFLSLQNEQSEAVQALWLQNYRADGWKTFLFKMQRTDRGFALINFFFTKLCEGILRSRRRG